MVKYILTVFFLVISPNILLAGFFGPSNYDECVSKYVTKTKSSKGAVIVARACRDKFKDKTKKKYANCIFKNVPYVKSSKAAILVTRACSYKFVAKTRVDFANCLLSEVINAQTDKASIIIAISCSNRYPEMKKLNK